MSDNRQNAVLLQSINYGTLKFSTFEKTNNDRKYKNYCFQGSVYNKDTKEYENTGTIGLETFSDLSSIKRLLVHILQSRDGFVEIEQYSIESVGVENKQFTLYKTYQANDGTKKQQQLKLTKKDNFAMQDLIDRVIAINVKPNSQKKDNEHTTNKGSFVEKEEYEYCI